VTVAADPFTRHRRAAVHAFSSPSFLFNNYVLLRSRPFPFILLAAAQQQQQTFFSRAAADYRLQLQPQLHRACATPLL
jgi:hypothetical protein